MKPINSTWLAATLVAAPLLLASSEVVRKYVALGQVNSGDPMVDARDKILQVAAHSDLWLVHSYLTLLGILAWLGAMIAITAAIRARRPVLGAVGGVLGLGSAIGYAAHLGFYTIPLGVSAGMAEQDLNAAATVWVAGNGDPFTEAMVLFFITTMVFGQLVLGLGLWRARAVPWWAAACLPLSAALNLEPGSSPLWGLVMLLPLIPFLCIAVNGTPAGASPRPLALSLGTSPSIPVALPEHNDRSGNR
jgi:hypothetical protein